jgi:hypothetical protein
MKKLTERLEVIDKLIDISIGLVTLGIVIVIAQNLPGLLKLGISMQ